MSIRRGLPCHGRLALAHGSLALTGSSAWAASPSGAASPAGGWSLGWAAAAGAAPGSTAGARTSAAAVGSSLTRSRYPLIGGNGAMEAAQRSVHPTGCRDLDLDLELGRENPRTPPTFGKAKVKIALSERSRGSS